MQRRAVGNSDLPQVKKELDEYLECALRQRWRSVIDLSLTCGIDCDEGENLPRMVSSILSGSGIESALTLSCASTCFGLDQACDVNPESANLADLYPGTYFNYIDISKCSRNESGKF